MSKKSGNVIGCNSTYLTMEEVFLNLSNDGQSRWSDLEIDAFFGCLNGRLLTTTIVNCYVLAS